MGWPTFLLGTAKGLVRVHEGLPTIWHEKGKMHAGLSWSDDTLFAAARYYQPMDGPRPGPEKIQCWDKGAEQPRELCYESVQAIHQIFYWRGRLYVTAPGCDSIDIVDPETGEFERWNWTGVTDHDQHHINSVWADPGGYLWVCHNNFGTGIPGALLHFSPERKLLETITLGSALHNVFWLDGVMYTCSSNDGQVLACDVHGDILSASVPYQRYLRGLAATEEALYIGMSTISERTARFEGPSWILKLDYELRFLDLLAIPNTGQIGEVRIISEPDLAHNRLPFPGGPGD